MSLFKTPAPLAHPFTATIVSTAKDAESVERFAEFLQMMVDTINRATPDVIGQALVLTMSGENA